ncbi:PKD domain-containing protein [Geodermatophilus sp. CPCC 206100]|uniref:PKD domain-containing protein n=1 Tax=Geodermatophilus sp. CPCC 206100 TaxID=3020054 RepID=UPI003AFF90D9
MGERSSAAPKRVVAGALSALLMAGGLAFLAPGTAAADSAPAVPSPTNPATVAADPLPTVQVDGVVWSQVVVGNTVYAAGKFGRARPAGAALGTQETVRNNLLAYDIRTGALVTSFAPDLNAQAMVVAASPDGTRLYVGGDFTRANGQVRNRIAAYDTRTGALVGNWAPSANGQVRALAATNDTVYFGGSLTAVGPVSRTRLAAVRASDGGLLPWAPVPGVGPSEFNRDGNRATSNTAMALVVTGGGSQVVAAGRWDTMGGVRATGVTALDPVTGANRGYAVNTVLTNQGINSAVYSLSTDGANVFGTAYDYWGPGNLEGSFSVRASDGAINWVSNCYGDTYASFPMNGALYHAGHPHQCGEIGGFPEQSPRVNKFAMALSVAPAGSGTSSRLYGGSWQGKPAPAPLAWFPSFAAGTFTQQNQATWSVSGNGTYAVYGGEFPRVGGVAQQGLVRFAVPSSAPNKVGPDFGPVLTPSVTSPTAGAVRVVWRATSDPDNVRLTYRVTRADRPGQTIYSTTADSTWWDRPALGFTDRDVVPGQTYNYKVTAVDPFGNTASGNSVPVTVAAAAPAGSAYAATVLADSPQHYWRLDDAAGTGRSVDQVGVDDLLFGSGVTQGGTGATAGTPGASAAFNGTVKGTGAMSTRGPAPNTMSVETWFSTRSVDGGVLLDFSDVETGLNGGAHDRMLHLDTAGHVLFSVWPGWVATVASPGSYNDGAWHHVVATLGPAGMALYVDGRLVGSRTDATGGQDFRGAWRFGGDGRWTGNTDWFTGRLDEVAVYGTPLSAAQVRTHHDVGRSGVAANRAPAAVFGSSVTDLTASFDGRASSDVDGTIRSHSWSFGDGTTGTGATVQHAYSRPGTYSVRLTVTDSAGATGTVTQPVTVTAPVPNQPPTAAFTAAATGLVARVDGTASADADGTVASHAWDFGDGSSGTGGTASHAYPKAGTYTVQLTVTDDDGARTTTTRQVTVAPTAGPQVLAQDAFGRTATNGLGSAEVGGAWTASVGATRLSVTPGAAEFGLPGAGNNTAAFLGEVAQTAADVRTSFTLSAAPTGTGTYVYVTGRRVGANQEYRVRVRVMADGKVGLALSRLSGGESFPGGEVVVTGVTWSPGAVLNVRVQVTGTGTTQVTGAVWAEGSAEPAPQLVRTDTTAALQAPGSVGLAVHRPGGTTAATTVRVPRFAVTEVR